MVVVNVRLNRDEVEILEKILDDAFGISGKRGLKTAGKDLFSEERFRDMAINYKGSIVLQARLDGNFYNTNLEINTTHPDYNSFLEQCRTKMRKVYDKLTNTDSEVASAV